MLLCAYTVYGRCVNLSAGYAQSMQSEAVDDALTVLGPIFGQCGCWFQWEIVTVEGMATFA